MELKFCQSCGMPLSEGLFGTNADGRFLQDCTMDEMIGHCAQFVDEVDKQLPEPVTREQYIAQMKQYFPHLKRWSGR